MIFYKRQVVYSHLSFFDNIGNFVPYITKKPPAGCALRHIRKLLETAASGVQSGASPSRIEEFGEFEADLSVLFSKKIEKKEKRMNSYEKLGDTIIVKLPAEIDDYRARQLVAETEEAFHDTRVRYVIFDFSKTDIMDSSGIGLITRRFRNVYDRGGKAFVLNVNSRMDRILKMSGIYRITTKAESVEAAYRDAHKPL